MSGAKFADAVRGAIAYWAKFPARAYGVAMYRANLLRGIGEMLAEGGHGNHPINRRASREKLIRAAERCFEKANRIEREASQRGAT